MNIVAVIQARMGSTRLPGKVLAPLGSVPMLSRVVQRVRRASTLHDVVIATTMDAADDAVSALCSAHGWPCFRGSHNDVLDRYCQAARCCRADVIVRLTADCPLLDAEVIDEVVLAFQQRQPMVHYASNVWPQRTYPRGLDTEVIRRDALEKAWREDGNPAWREHVTPYIYRHPELFSVHPVCSGDDLSKLRWTVDTPADYAFVQRIYEHFGHDRFGWEEVVRVLDRYPAWMEINRSVVQKAA